LADLGVDGGLFQQDRVPRCQGFHLRVGQGVPAEVVDLAGIQATLGDLGDEGRFAFHRLPSPYWLDRQVKVSICGHQELGGC